MTAWSRLPRSYRFCYLLLDSLCTSPIHFLWWTGSAGATWPEWSDSQHTVALRAIVNACLERALSEYTLHSNVLCIGLHSYRTVSLAAHDPVGGSPQFLSWTTNERCWPVKSRTSYRCRSCQAALTQSSSHHNSALLKVAQDSNPYACPFFGF